MRAQRPTSARRTTKMVLLFSTAFAGPVLAQQLDAKLPVSSVVAVALEGTTLHLAEAGDASSSMNPARRRTLDVSQVPEARDPVLSSDGTALMLTYRGAQGPASLVVDLTRKERTYDGEAFAEARAVLEALDAGDPCQRQQPHDRSGTRMRRSRRCVATFFEAAPRLPDALHIQNLPGDVRFFEVTLDPSLYLPALELATQEEVFPGPVDTLSKLSGTHDFEQLLHAYLRGSVEQRKADCRVYYAVTRHPGAWLIEFWFYFPFDSGGQGPHFHDSEHVFVEVDVLGGWVRRVIGAGHGSLAGNNVYEAWKPGAPPADLPLLVAVELAKHATAPDIDRDFAFTPGIDENFYSERAKVWGVRDVIGDNNNHVLAYERTMSAPRLHSDILAEVRARDRYPNHADLAEASCSCKLVPIDPQWPRGGACDGSWKKDPSAACARQQIAGHDDHQDPRQILKKWMYPPAAIRASVGMGPRNALSTIGIGVALDVDRIPWVNQKIKLPGRLAFELQGWSQGIDSRDEASCVQSCDQERGWGASLRYEQLLSNLFGAYFGMRRFYSDGAAFDELARADETRGTEMWFVLGPMIEFPTQALGKWRFLFPGVGNVGFQGGLAVRQTSSPRYELRVNLGLVRFTTPRFGVRE